MGGLRWKHRIPAENDDIIYEQPLMKMVIALDDSLWKGSQNEETLMAFAMKGGWGVGWVSRAINVFSKMFF